MIKNKKHSPSDIEGVKLKDLDEWFQDFNWPLNWNELIQIEDKVKNVLNKKIETEDKYYEIILISYKIFIEYSNFIYALLIIEKGNNLKFSKTNEYFYNIKENQVPQIPIISFPELKKSSTYLRKKYRTYKKILQDNKFNIFKPFLKKTYFFVESRSPHTINFLKKKKKFISPISFFDIYDDSNVVELSDNDKNNLDEISRLIVEDLKIVIKEYDISFTEKQNNYLRGVTYDVFYKSLQALNSVKVGLKKKRIELYMGSNNSFLSRIMSVAIRNNGGKIHGFSHGEPLIYNWDKISWMELSLNTNYYEYTEKLSEELKKVHAGNFQYRNQVKIESFNSDVFTKFHEQATNRSINDSCKKVMLIGNAYRETGMTSVTSPPGVIQLQIEMEIINKLKEIGYSVLYKKHPGGYFENRKLPFSEYVEIIDAPFEATYQSADVLIFYYTRTTTFGYALSSDKHVVVIDSGIEEIKEETLKLIEKQCSYFKANYNNSNKFCIEEKKLKEALEIKKTNKVYYKEYLSS